MLPNYTFHDTLIKALSIQPGNEITEENVRSNRSRITELSSQQPLTPAQKALIASVNSKAEHLGKKKDALCSLLLGYLDNPSVDYAVKENLFHRYSSRRRIALWGYQNLKEAALMALVRSRPLTPEFCGVLVLNPNVTNELVWSITSWGVTVEGDVRDFFLRKVDRSALDGELLKSLYLIGKQGRGRISIKTLITVTRDFYNLDENLPDSHVEKMFFG